MIDTLVDTNVLIDLSDDKEKWFTWSARRVEEAVDAGRLLLNQVIYSELAGSYTSREELDAALTRAGMIKETIPWDAAFMAGLVFRAYRDRGGTRLTPLADFFIGAHAAVRGYRLLTRDRGYFAFYFPSLDIIAPDTHP